jgi:hypothetical protein
MNEEPTGPTTVEDAEAAIERREIHRRLVRRSNRLV